MRIVRDTMAQAHLRAVIVRATQDAEEICPQCASLPSRQPRRHRLLRVRLRRRHVFVQSAYGRRDGALNTNLAGSSNGGGPDQLQRRTLLTPKQGAHYRAADTPR